MSGEWATTHVPTSIAGYNVSERLGAGAFSVVYKGLSAAPGPNGVRSTVAIKCINMQTANSSKLNSDCVVSEISILKTLKHRNIVRLYDFQWDRNNIYLIMEFCGGGDLGSFIRKHGSLPEAVTRKFFRQLACGLQYMRAMNVAHMDLKPQNILLSNKYRPSIKISDFGLSQCLKKSESSSSFRGSPLYMAPEIFARRKYDSRVDLWSSGVILYECLYGKAPFSSDTYEKLVSKILSSEPISYPSTVKLSAECSDILRGLLVRDPQRRMTFEQFFSHPFVALLKMQSAQEFEKADEYIAKARIAEDSKKTAEAIQFLTLAIQLYMSRLEILDDREEKARLRRKIKETLERAEYLKETIRPVSEEPLPSSSKAVSEWSDIPQVDAAIIVASNARKLMLEEKWSEALEKYTLAIDGAMRVLANERDTPRATKLGQQVSGWLTTAQRLQEYMKVLNLETLSVEKDDEAERQLKRFESQCRVS
ncbi:unnamed protein product [Enterobius vermicularis]|uniref:non-specific serine/threonine protein kinase n=1 Tax=Enterobius vermicularis TaxID=51028 RepID=A0A0N4UW11_ENTVE|nr:unnamed protein product [Enterobius vermicularis]